MNQSIYCIAGSKGGVGKSILAMGVLNYLLGNGKEPIFVETDTTNPDVWKSYRTSCESIVLDLDEADGWIQLINHADSRPGCPIVINTAARNNRGVERYGKTLQSTLKDLQRELVTMWVINRQRDSLELLLDYMDALPESTVHVMRNNYFGQPHKFELFNTSDVKKSIEERGGLSLDIPDLADRVADDLYSKRLSILEASKELPLGNRAELIRWRNELNKILSGVLHGTV
jgi:hypothetical protein